MPITKPRPEPRFLRGGRPPLVIAWELTKACPLACRHCRASAQHHPHPAERSACGSRSRSTWAGC